MTLFSDPPFSLYLLLAVAVVIAGAVWVNTRRRRPLIAFIVCLVLLGLLFALDYSLESPREQANRRIQAMADAATAMTPDRFVENLSNSFKYGTADRNAIRNSRVWELIRQHNARVAVWGLDKSEFKVISETEIEVGFYAKGEARGQAGAVLRFVRSRFVKDPDGEYRLQTFKFFSVDGSSRGEDPIPGFP